MQLGGTLETWGYSINDAFRDWSALRFTGLNIPQGASITNAYIQYPTSTGNILPETDPAEVKLYAEAVDDAPVFSTTGDGLDDRSASLTTTSIDWDIPGMTEPLAWFEDYRTPNIASLVEEVVSRPGWSSGNAIAIFSQMRQNGTTGSRSGRVGLYDGVLFAPFLVVEWTSTTAASGSNAETIEPNTAYEVRLDLGQSEITTPGYAPTVTDSAASGALSNNDPNDDIRDNDSSESSGSAVIGFTTGNWGENNHGLDFGFRDAAACTITATATVNACTNVGNDSDSSNDTYTVTLNVSGSNTSGNFNYSSTAAGVGENGVAFTASPYTTPAINIEATDSPHIITVTDSVDNACTVDILPAITEPATCSTTATCTTVTNNVSITNADQTDTDVTNDTDTADLAVNCSSTPEVDVSLVKTVSTTEAIAGDIVVYTLTVSNAGPDAASGVVVEDPLPLSQITYVSDDGGADTSVDGAGVLTWNVGSIPANDSRTLNITVTVN